MSYIIFEYHIQVLFLYIVYLKKKKYVKKVLWKLTLSIQNKLGDTNILTIEPNLLL